MAHDPAAGEAAPVPDQVRTRAASRPPEAGQRGGIKTFSSLQNNPNYRFLFAGNLFANAAQWLQLFTVGWLVLELSGGSALQSATSVGIRTLPTLLLGPWAGALADRWDRRKIAIFVQVWLAVAASLFALLVASGEIAVWHAYVYMALSGIGFTMMQPVRQALVANTVPRSDLRNALALNAMTVTSMRLVGPLLGGILMETVGFKWNFLLQSSLYVGMFVLLLPMRTPYREASTNRKVSMWSNLAEGMGYILKNQVILRLNMMNIVRSAVFQPLVFLLPVYTKEVLDAGPGAGTALVTAMGLGGLSATVLISSWRFFTKKGLVSLIALMAGSVCILLLGLAQWLWLSMALLGTQGFFQTHFIVSNMTSIQTVVPDSLRGRVSSVWQYLDGLIPMWVFLIGLLAELTGIRLALMATGALALGFSISYMLRFKDIRALD